MNSVFVRIGAISPILEIELELIKERLNQGDKITLYNCNDKLPTCFFNNSRVQTVCNVCKKNFITGLNSLNIKNKINIKDLDLSKISTKEFNIKKYNFYTDVKNFTYKGSNLGYGIVSSLVSKYSDHKLINVPESVLEREIMLSIKIYDFFIKELMVFKPDQIYFFNGRITESHAIREVCKKLNINYFTYENPFVRKDRFSIHDLNFINSKKVIQFIKSFKSYEALEKILNKLKNLVSPFHARQLLKRQIKNLLPKNFDKNKRNIVIFNSSMDEFESIPNLQHKIYQPDNNFGIKKILHDFRKYKEFFFYIRVHPGLNRVSQKISQINDVLKLEDTYSNVKIIRSYEKIDSYQLLQVCEKTLTFGSTIGAEATYWGKPSIVLNNSYYDNLNCVYTPRNHNQVIKLIKKKNLKPKKKTNSYKYFIFYFFYGNKFKHFQINKSGLLCYKGKMIRAEKYFILLNKIIYLIYYLPKKFILDPNQFLVIFYQRLEYFYKKFLIK
jgi:hypothetical protein